jgi:hypothetical protein
MIGAMKYSVHMIIYPEGDRKEIDHPLRFDQMVDINGLPIRLPLPTSKMIVYRVYRISSRETRNEDIREYHLEQVWKDELEAYT